MLMWEIFWYIGMVFLTLLFILSVCCVVWSIQDGEEEGVVVFMLCIMCTIWGPIFLVGGILDELNLTHTVSYTITNAWTNFWTIEIPTEYLLCGGIVILIIVFISCEIKRGLKRLERPECPECGEKQDRQAKFCYNCGVKL